MEMKFANRTYREAISYYKEGFSVIPCKEKSKEPLIDWKKYQNKKAGWRIRGKGGTAELLKIKPTTLYSRMERLVIPTRRRKDAHPDNG